MDKLIVTIDREYGSGGHEVARRLCDRLGLKLYDDEIIEMAAMNTGYMKDYIKYNDETAPQLNIPSVYSGIDTFQTATSNKIQDEEFRIIRRIAEEGNCVIVGRAADYILGDIPHISIFIFAPLVDRIRRKLALIEINGTDPMTEYEMEKKVKQRDKQRRKYYEFYTDNKWGAHVAYDVMINTSRSGINAAVDIIEAYIKGGKGKDLLSDM